MTCRVLKLARQPYYRWRAHPIADAEIVEAYRANALFDAHHEDPEFGYRYPAIAWHERNNSLEDRPAAVEVAIEQERFRQREEERRQVRTELNASRAARRAAQSRLGSPAHLAVRQVAAEIAARAERKRVEGVEAEHQARAELVARASRSHGGPSGPPVRRTPFFRPECRPTRVGTHTPLRRRAPPRH